MPLSREIELTTNPGRLTGEYVASDNVVSTIRGLVEAGKISEAASLFAGSNDAVGNELVEDLALVTSKQIARSFSKMFATARDYERAAYCAELAGDTESAAQLYERGYAYKRSRDHYLDNEMYEGAAGAAERAGDLLEAAKLYRQADDPARAADTLVQAGRIYEAARLYIEAGRWNTAVEILQQVQPDSPDSANSLYLLGNIYQHHDELGMAAKCYLKIIDTTEKQLPDPDHARIYYRLGQVYVESGREVEAKKLFRVVQQLAPNYKEVERFMTSLANVNEGGQEQGTQEFFDLSGGVETPDVPPPKAPEVGRAVLGRMVLVDRNINVIAEFPLFNELSLSELKRVYRNGEIVRIPAGDVIISEGEPGRGLFVVISGEIRVTTVDPLGDPVELETQGPGGWVGEISLLDDSPTSANVIAASNVVAFRLSRKMLNQVLSADDRIALRFYRSFAKGLSERVRRLTKQV